MNCKIESCLQVKRSKYELQPATTCNRDSALRQNEHSEDDVSPHFCKFLRVGNELLI